MAERLLLEASVVDKFSQPLRDLRNQLKNLPRPKAIEGLKKDFDALRKSVTGAGKDVANEFSRSLTGIGLASFTAAGAIAAMGKAVRDFSGNAENVDSLSRSTHLSRETIQRFTATASAFGIGADAMAGDLSHLSKEFRLIQAGASDAINYLRAKNPELLAFLQKPSTTVEEATKRTVEFLKSLPQDQRQFWSEKFFGSDDLEKMLRDVPLFEQRMAHMAARLKALSPFDVENAKQFNTAIADLQQSMSTLQNTVGAQLAPAFTASADALDRILNENRVQLSERFARDFGLIAAAAEKVKQMGEAVGNLPVIGPSAAQVGRDMFDPVGAIKRDLETIGSYLGIGGAHAAEAPQGSAMGSIMGLRKQFEDTKKGTKEGVLDALREWNGLSGGGGGVAEGAGAIGAISRGPHHGQRVILGGGGGARGGSAPPEAMRKAMAAAMDQYQKEGGLAANARAAAAMIVGQAMSESGLNPNAVHDHGTGYGIYGARDPNGPGRRRRSEMLAWLAANGFPRNSLEGQQREMMHQAMSGLYPRTRRALMGATPENMADGTWTLTREFESPAVINDRTGATWRAYRSGSALRSSNAFGLGGSNYAAAGGKPATLNVNVVASGNVKTSADGGSHFETISVKRSRPMADRGDWGN